MSALWLELVLILCFYGTARTDADVEGVVWRYVGQSITIQCKSTSHQESLYLKRGLNEEQDVFYTSIDSSKHTINNKFTDRLQFHGNFPNVDILIKNLTLNDTGPYWCVYKMMDKNYTPKTTKGRGSVLLVVTENRPSPTVPECAQSQSNPVLVYVVICAAVVIFVLTVSVILIVLKKKHLHTTARTGRDENASGRENGHKDAL